MHAGLKIPQYQLCLHPPLLDERPSENRKTVSDGLYLTLPSQRVTKRSQCRCALCLRSNRQDIRSRWKQKWNRPSRRTFPFRSSYRPRQRW